MKIVIIEDEPATAKRLENLVQELLPGVINLATIDTVEESIAFFQNNPHPDLAFMDIQLADGISFDIFEKVEINCPVIFTTAYDQYAIKAFQVNSIDYLLKPIKQQELANSLKKYQKVAAPSPVVLPDYQQLAELIRQQSKPGLKRIVVKIGQTIKATDISEIAYFTVENKLVYAFPKKGNRFPVDQTMDFLENELDPKQFFRVNRGIIVSFESIQSMFSYSKSRIKILLNPPYSEDIITSSERTNQFKEWLKGK
jgi:DNA-binding LytR/AlgR family response regulator